MKRYYIWFIFILLILGSISFLSPFFVSGQATSKAVEINGADAQQSIRVEVSAPDGWQLHPILFVVSRENAAQNYTVNAPLIQNFFEMIGQSHEVMADVMVQHADLTRRYSLDVHPISELSAPVPQMQIIVSRADRITQSTFSRPAILGDALPTPTVTNTATPIPTETATYSPTPTATDIPATDTTVPNTATPIPTETTVPVPPTYTATIMPTLTTMPTSVPDTATPSLTATQLPATDIPTPIPATITPVPPMDTPTVMPTLTTMPTSVPDTVTPVPTSIPSDTPTATQVPATMTPVPATATPTPIRGDAYETDDLCSVAQVLPVDGERQDHTFHQEGDEDWVQMELQADTTYELSAISTSPRADLAIELYVTCSDSVPEESDVPAFGAGAKVELTPNNSGTYYAKIVGQKPDIYGSDVTYTLELKELAPQGDIAIIIMGHDDGYKLQNNIFNATNTAYRAFRNGGIPKDRIRYLGLIDDDRGDADHDEISDVDTVATTANVEDVITNWAVEQAGNESRVYIYMMDHGLVDQMMIDGSDDILTPDELDQWLGVLEAETGADVAVIYEACLSGSFITGTENIGRSGRIVITSTTDDANAYPRRFGGALFSDSFFPALSRGETLYEAYRQGRNASVATMENQRPMLDDNGDRQSNSKDGDLARSWILNTNAALSDEDEVAIPVLAEPQTPTTINNDEGMIRVAIRENERVKQVWVEVRSPNYTEPATATDGIMPELDLPVVSLSDSDQDGIYIGVYEGFVEAGVYRFVAHAEDVDGNMLSPSSTEMEITPAELDGTSKSPVESDARRIYLPLISR